MKRLIIFILLIFCFTGCAVHQKEEVKPINIIEIPVVPLELGEDLEGREKAIEYEAAHYIWEYLKELEYNDYVIAGILGNIMVECGSDSLELQVKIDSGTHYGIAQWSKKYYPEIVGASLNDQCNFLRDNIQFEINTFGNKYKKDFNYTDFISLTDEREAALAFAKSYERCGSGSYERRQSCAEVVYNYFMAWPDTTVTSNQNMIN